MDRSIDLLCQDKNSRDNPKWGEVAKGGGGEEEGEEAEEAWRTNMGRQAILRIGRNT